MVLCNGLELVCILRGAFFNRCFSAVCIMVLRGGETCFQTLGIVRYVSGTIGDGDDVIRTCGDCGCLEIRVGGPNTLFFRCFWGTRRSRQVEALRRCHLVVFLLDVCVTDRQQFDSWGRRGSEVISNFASHFFSLCAEMAAKLTSGVDTS
jgi:hypothetical protein